MMDNYTQKIFTCFSCGVCLYEMRKLETMFVRGIRPPNSHSTAQPKNPDILDTLFKAEYGKERVILKLY